MKKTNLEAKFTKSSENFSKLKGKTQNFEKKLKNSSKKTQGFGKSTWSTCRKSVEKKSLNYLLFKTPSIFNPIQITPDKLAVRISNNKLLQKK